MVWLAIRDNDPGTLSLEKVTELLTDELENVARMQGDEAKARKRQEIEQAIDQASGEDLVGNSNGSLQGAETESKPAEG